MKPYENANVSTPRHSVHEANERGRLPQDLLGGTVRMQKEKTKYVSKGVDEADSVYNARIKAGVLLNIYKRTVGMLSGQVFSRDVALMPASGETLPDPYASMVDDIDLQGNSLTRWSADFFEDAMNRGAGVLLVDFPRVETRTVDGVTEYMAEDGTWQRKTAAADAANGWRPYFVNIPQCRLLGWRFKTVNGKKVLDQLRFKETVTDETGDFDVQDKKIEQVRVLYPGRWEIWRKKEDVKDHDEWYLYEEGTTSLNVIPAVPLILGEKCGDMCANPALEDLAHLNRRHWQATVDQFDLISWMRRPVWVGVNLQPAGDDSTKQINWGPGTLINTNGSDVSLESVSVAPESVEKGQLDLDNLKTEMSMFGMRLLMPRDVETTATTDRLNAAENDSTLKKWAMAFKDCLEQAFVFADMWVGGNGENAPSVAVNTEFHLLAGMTVEEIDKMVANGVISKRMAFDEAKRRGLIPDDADWQENLAEIENDNRQGEGPSLGAGIAANMLGGNQT